MTVIVDRAAKEFAPGMGVGVLMSCEAVFDLPPAKYDSPMFPLALLEHQKRLRDEVIRMGAEEVLTPAPVVGTRPGATVKRTFKLTVVVDRATKEFAPGLGIGVLSWCEVTFDLPPAKYDSSMFALALLEHQERLRDEVIRMGAEEVLAPGANAAAVPTEAGALPTAGEVVP